VVCGWLASGAALAIPEPSDGPTNGSAAMRSWWDDNPWADQERGFNWYPDQQPKRPVEGKKPDEKKPKTIYEMTSLDEVEKELKRLKGKAILNPTEAHVHEFLQAQNFVMNKSSVFADVARRVVWANPDVNYAARNAVVNSSRLADARRKDAEREKTVRELAQEHGIVFFARSDCAYCHDQAPILKMFERSWGMEVLAISLDGGTIPEFPDARMDNGISRIVSNGQGVTTVPALFLINRKTREAIPLGTGVVAATDLAERIRVLTRTRPGDEF
jgi:conjugal transfer pilus assembly protein TraF